MAYLYLVDLTNGTSYNVTLNEHHDDHSNEQFKKFLVNVLDSVVTR
jgi:hypothetical protein